MWNSQLKLGSQKLKKKEVRSRSFQLSEGEIIAGKTYSTRGRWCCLIWWQRQRSSSNIRHQTFRSALQTYQATITILDESNPNFERSFALKRNSVFAWPVTANHTKRKANCRTNHARVSISNTCRTSTFYFRNFEQKYGFLNWSHPDVFSLKYSKSKFSQKTTNLLSIINVTTCFDS